MLLRIIFLNVVTFCTFESSAQQIVRSTIGSTGSSQQQNGILIQSTSGQAATVSKLNKNISIGISQGFHRSDRIQKTDNGMIITLFPNPNNGHFQFYTDLSNEISFEFQIIDIFGRIIQSHSGKGNEMIPVDVSQCASGSYILRIITPNQTANLKFEKTP